MKKKYLTLVVAIMLVMSALLCGCGEKQSKEEKESIRSAIKTDEKAADEIVSTIKSVITDCDMSEIPIPDVNNITMNELCDSSVTGKFGEMVSNSFWGGNIECKQKGKEFRISISKDSNNSYAVSCEIVDK